MSFTASLTCVDGWTPPTSPAPVSRPALLTASRSTSAGFASDGLTAAGGGPPSLVAWFCVARPPPLCNRTSKLKLEPPPITRATDRITGLPNSAQDQQTIQGR